MTHTLPCSLPVPRARRPAARGAEHSREPPLRRHPWWELCASCGAGVQLRRRIRPARTPARRPARSCTAAWGGAGTGGGFGRLPPLARGGAPAT
eukprot:3808917-Prymnesium_polylepis.1